MGIKEKGEKPFGNNTWILAPLLQRKERKRGLNSRTTGRAMTYIMAAFFTAKCCAGASDSAREILQLRLLFLKIKWH